MNECLERLEVATDHDRTKCGAPPVTLLQARKMVDALVPPLVFVQPRHTFAYKLMNRIPRTRARRIRRDTLYIARRLQMLLDRVQAVDLNSGDFCAAGSRLYRTIVYYRLSLQTLMHTIDQECTKEGRSPRRRLAASLQSSRLRMQQSVDVSAEIIAEFDERQYLDESSDIRLAVSGGSITSGLEHFVSQGWKEACRGGRSSGGVSAELLAQLAKAHGIELTNRCLAPSIPPESCTADSVNGDSAGSDSTDGYSPALDTQARNIRYFANPGPSSEEPSALNTRLLTARFRAIAFYLPQFHAFAQNDKWWGKGFTEWRNVARGTPRYSGHYQPRIPRDLGFYDLNDDSVMIEQSRLAMQNGIEAFCFYYYWFNGEKLMDMPLERFLRPDIEQDFCIMWANENWTRTWDGFDSEVLIRQDYHDKDEDAFLADTARYMGHERYMKVDGRPLFILYRPGLLPSARETLARWRKRWSEQLGVEPVILMVQGFGDEDPRAFALDGAVEFPPHKLCTDIAEIQGQMQILDPDFSGQVKSYEDVIDTSLSEKTPAFPLVKTVVPHWDNDARREGRGFTMQGSTPALYESWLNGVAEHAIENPLLGESLVFINAWNEWAEGAYLEPDVHFGHAYLNATQRAIHGLSSAQARSRILLVGHDAFPHGAQLLLLNIARTMKQQFGLDVTILLKSSGPLMSDYQGIARTVVLDQLGQTNLQGWLRREGFSKAICNTTVTGDLVPLLRAAGCRTVSLIHEMPTLIKEYALEQHVVDIASSADHVVFPSVRVEEGFRQFSLEIANQTVIRPQGLYTSIELNETARAEVRQRLGIAENHKVIMNAGYADLRKGFDIFIEAARHLCSERNDVHFVWVGNLSDDMRRWLGSDLVSDVLASNFHHVEFSDQMADFYSASDCLFLTSREDPYPSVVLEAMCIGLPVVFFGRSTGFDFLADGLGYCCDRQQPMETQRTLVQALFRDFAESPERRKKFVREQCQFDDYCFDLLQMLDPELRKVSVVVPNYNYAGYLPERMQSIFNQDHPIFEVLVLDDCSTDDSLHIIEQVAAASGRNVQVVPNLANSGNVFRQWARGARMARGEQLWMAEADDSARCTFLTESVRALRGGAAFSFSDSHQVGTNNETLATSYDYYYRQVDRKLFKSDFVMSGRDFIKRAMSVRNVVMNVSSILWNTQALRAGLEAEGESLYEHRLVGDWRLYLRILGGSGAEVAYLSNALNVHRRHQSSVTHALDHQSHLDEIMGVHGHALELLGGTGRLAGMQNEYVTELREQFGLAAPSSNVKRQDRAA